MNLIMRDIQLKIPFTHILKNIIKFGNIGFYLGSDTNESLCGIIGFKMDGFDSKCGKINNIIKSFKSRDIINNYKWIIK